MIWSILNEDSTQIIPRHHMRDWAPGGGRAGARGGRFDHVI